MKITIRKPSKLFIALALMCISILSFIYFYENGFSLLYNDARSHLDISRRVVENLKPGFAQIGSVWLPLPHILMLPTIWNDFLWHSGLSGAIVSMLSYLATAYLIYKYLARLKLSQFAKLFGLAIFALNLNILYLQSTAMTELLLLATMTAAAYFLMLWFQGEKLLNLILAAFFTMLSTLVRYDGWFLLFCAMPAIAFYTYKKYGFKQTEGTIILFGTLAGFGIFLWLLWNLVIFHDPLYFAFGPFSAHAQQAQLEAAGDLRSKGNILLSIRLYFDAMLYNSYAPIAILGLISFVFYMFSKAKMNNKLAVSILISPLLFNVVALYLGHSVLFVSGISGHTWFNIRYGAMMIPSIAIFMGLLVDKLKNIRWSIVLISLLTIFFSFTSHDAVTLDDARFGSSGKNVAEVSQWLSENAGQNNDFILMSVASHDAIIFSSSLKMSRFIHEGTGLYWESATKVPDKWARYIIMRTNDNSDLTFKLLNETNALSKYNLVESYPFADIYELDSQYLDTLNSKKIFY